MRDYTGSAKRKRTEHAIEVRLFVKTKDRAEAEKFALILKDAVLKLATSDFKMNMAYTGSSVDVQPLE